ncbi:MAG TPA: hypothetical protein VFL59_09870 [Candidatus Nanopelagicales bacterium]|nr:hypothetical protein [Candidatus Nanopelagicales bacterium]
MSAPAGRDNGLPEAARYVALVDVDPPVADHVLELLRDAGVTAVAVPLAGDRGPARDTRPPKRPTDRVHVDVGQVGLAQEVVGRALPGLRADFHADAARRADADDMSRGADDLAPDDVEARFADIVAGFDEPGSDPVPRWSVLEDAGDALPPFEPPERPPLSSRLLRSDPGDRVPDHEVDDHFVPDPPPPLPESDRVTRLAWAGLVGGPVLIMLAAIFGIGLQGIVLVVAIGAFLGGFATLVLRMGDRRSDDDGWDDGAVL